MSKDVIRCKTRFHSQALRALLMSRCKYAMPTDSECFASLVVAAFSVCLQKKTFRMNASIHPECLFYKRMAHCYAHYLFENFFNVLSAVFVAFLGRVAVYLLRTVESSGLLYAAGGNCVYYLQNFNSVVIQ